MSLRFKLSSGLSSLRSYDDSELLKAQQQRQIRAINAIQATDKPATMARLLSLLLFLGTGFAAFLILTASGPASGLEEKTLLLACLAGGEKE
jgi:hypothetical protein